MTFDVFDIDRELNQLIMTKSMILFSNSTTLPWTINDVRSAGDMEELVNLTFESAVVSNLHKNYKCTSCPILTCNTPVVAELARSNR